MRNICLTLSRFAISAWVGAACLFVVTTLKEVHSPQLDSVAKAELAVLRFPVYYMFAFGLVAVAVVTFAAAPHSISKVRRILSVGIAALVLLLTTIDYFWIYQPLAGMTAAVQEARPAEFVALHQASKWINTTQICISLVAALLLCWPAGGVQEPSQNT